MVCSKFAVAILWPLIAPLEDASIVYIGSFAAYQPSHTAGFWFAANTLLDHLGPRTIVLADKAYDADRIRGGFFDPVNTR
jgi:hypothetical protein